MFSRAEQKKSFIHANEKNAIGPSTYLECRKSPRVAFIHSSNFANEKNAIGPSTVLEKSTSAGILLMKKTQLGLVLS